MITFVIPAFNEAPVIIETVSEIINVLQSLTDIVDNFEIIVVDDHSNDGMYQKLADLKDSRIHCLRLSKRSGSHVALRAGLAYCTGRMACCLSADGQDNPNALPSMIQKWKNGAHIVWAIRQNRENEPYKVKIFAALFYNMLKILNPQRLPNIDLSRADFYLLDRKVIDAINHSPERNTSLFGLIAWLGFRQEYIEYDRRDRRHGNSKWSFRSRIRLAMDWIVSFSGLPLKLMTLMGFAISALGLTYAAFVVARALFYGTPVIGWPTVITVILIMGGLQLVMTGVVGEYLWRTFDETKRRPLYFIETTTLDCTQKDQ